jgi:cation diffusion facilitator CzcD-associated flavoprotein CzcO
LTATDIGERIGKSAEEVHIWMYQRKPPLIVRDDVSGWRITTWGKDFGEERAVELTGGTVVWRIKWKRDVLRLFNVYDHEEMG